MIIGRCDPQHLCSFKPRYWSELSSSYLLIMYCDSTGRVMIGDMDEEDDFTAGYSRTVNPKWIRQVALFLAFPPNSWPANPHWLGFHQEFRWNLGWGTFEAFTDHWRKGAGFFKLRGTTCSSVLATGMWRHGA